MIMEKTDQNVRAPAKEALGGKFVLLKYMHKKRKWAEKSVI